MRDESVGVYIHVPFCERVCPYCDFAVVAARTLEPGSESRYVAAVLEELRQRRSAFEGRTLESVYLGGGTPSLLRPESVARLIERVVKAFPARGELEITLEVNPSSVERERLPGFREAGVNRLSVGVQSFQDVLLRRLGRAHKAAQAQAALEAARRAGFDNLSIDLIVAVPGQDLAALRRDLERTLAAAPEHVSAYTLSVEEGTPYALAVGRGQLVLPGEDEALAMLREVRARLSEAGLPPYEISSYARDGRRSVHNRRYWQRHPVLGLGMGAWSTDPPSPQAPFGLRRANERALAAWLRRIERGMPPPAGSLEILDARTARAEAAFLALRTREGLCARAFEAEFAAPPRAFFPSAIDELVAAGLLFETEAGDLRLSEAGWWLADSVCERFV